MPSKSANVKNQKQYEALKDKGMSKQRAAKIANSPDASKHGGEKSGSGGDSSQGGTTAQKKKAGRKGGKAAAKKGRPPSHGFAQVEYADPPPLVWHRQSLLHLRSANSQVKELA